MVLGQVYCYQDFAQNLSGTGYREIQICPTHLFGQQNDLSHMLLHVTDNLIDRLQLRYVSTLRSGSIRQSFDRKGIDDTTRLSNRVLEQPDQLATGPTPLRTELLLADSNIVCAANTVHDPLPHVSAKMQNQVGDGVLMSAVSLPHLLLTQSRHAACKKSSHLLELRTREVKKDSPDLVVHA